MAHRSARGALRERREVIIERLGALEVLDDADDERGALLRELEGVRRSLELITPPRIVLKRLRIVRGCDVPWESMVGSARVRHCGACDREVYDLTAMDPDEVEDFVRARRENLPCVRMYARPDGRYQDGPCAPAKRRLLRRALVLASALGLTGLLGALSGEANAEATNTPSGASSTFDAQGFATGRSAPSVRGSTSRSGRGIVSDDSGMTGEPSVSDTPYAHDLEALEAAFWADAEVARTIAGAGPGYMTLTVTVDTGGQMSAEVLFASDGLEEIAQGAARAARHVRARFRPREPVTTHWYRGFR